MKYLSEYRDASVVNQYLEELDKITTRPWTIMEICGGQTHSLVKNGIIGLFTEAYYYGSWPWLSSMCNAVAFN